MGIILTIIGMTMIFAFIFFAWILPVILSFKKAEDFGRNKAAWTILAVLFGWIPTIVLLVLGVKK